MLRALTPVGRSERPFGTSAIEGYELRSPVVSGCRSNASKRLEAMSSRRSAGYGLRDPQIGAGLLDSALIRFLRPPAARG